MRSGNLANPMISRDEIPQMLLEACPSFRGKWNEFVEQWKDEDELPLYLALAEFARHLISSLAEGDTSHFPVVFDAVERMHVDGDGYVKEATTVGLLESLQNTNLHESTEPEQFRPYLGPVSTKWWDKLCDFRERGSLLTDD